MSPRLAPRRSAGPAVLLALLVVLLAAPSGTTVAFPTTHVQPPGPHRWTSVGPRAIPPVPAHPPRNAPRTSAALRPSIAPPTLGPYAPRRAPFAWRGLSSPPGAEALDRMEVPKGTLGTAAAGGGWGGSSEWSDLAAECYGIWPSTGGQAAYLPNCYGHDEPGIAGYSTLPGSGGNATWSVTLPVSSAVGAMQSDLYSAIWFGMPLVDPYAWLDSCFLELQLYPDSSWTQSGVVLNNWIGAAVGWQIEATNGAEDPCFYQTLRVNGTDGPYLNMHGGDDLAVRMTGWTGSRAGEQLQVLDLTNRMDAPLTLYNSTANLPLDPAYGAAALPNGLQWTPGGELPVTFAFETGHTVAPYPNNNSYGGCSAGVPPATAAYPSVPCPSYDPASWIADSGSPWEISPPTFFNATASATATQVAFTQDLGGIAFIDSISNGKCTARDASEWCSYPWYSYSCTHHAFEFGATDWPTTTTDFGQYGEYQPTTVMNRAGLSYYPPTNASVPACGRNADTVTVGVASGGPAGASVHFLNLSTSANATVPGLLPGEYSLSAVSPPGQSFNGWSVVGNLQLGAPRSPVTTVRVVGNGSVQATYVGGSGPLTAVRFDTSDPNGSVQVVPGFEGDGVGPIPPATTVPSGGSLHLAPGLYSINALPGAASNFTDWSVGSGPIALAAPRLPFTWLTVLAGGGSAEVRMTSTASATEAIVHVYPVGDDNAANGTILFDGLGYWTFTSNSTVGDYIVRVPVGSYALAERSTAGTTFQGWSIGGVAVTLDSNNSTRVDLGNGSVYVFGIFSAVANITLSDVGANGTISLGAASFQANGSVDGFPSPPSGLAIAADPPGNASFTGWNVTPVVNATIAHRGAGVTTVSIVASATVTARFAPAPALGLAFSVVPAGAGTISLDGVPYGNGTSAPYLAAGLYVAQFTPGVDEFLHGWSGGPGVAVSNATPLGWPQGTELVNVTGAGGVLSAHAVRGTPPVTFLLSTPPGPTPTFRVNGTSVPHNGTLDVGAGPIPVSIQAGVPAGTVVRRWTADGGIRLVGATGLNATIFVNGSGSVMPLLAPAFTVTATAAPVNATDLGLAEWAPETVEFAANESNGSAPFVDQWSFGDGQTGVGPTASHRFDLAGVYDWEVVVTDHAGISGSARGSVVVGGPPTGVALNLTPPEGEAPFNVSVGLQTTGAAGASTFNWSVPSLGLSGNGPTGRFEVATLGAFLVDGLAADAQGFVAITSATVTAEPNVFLTVSQSASAGTVPLNVTFVAAAINATGSTNYSWSFGDGGTASTSIARHEYNRTGTFDANISVVDGLGGHAVKHLVVRVLPLPPPLVVQLRADPATMALGNTSTISTNATGGEPSYAVVYPPLDLPIGCVAIPVPPNASFRCTPQAAGDYLLRVNVTDSNGRMQTGTAWLNVTAPINPRVPPVVRSSSNNTSRGSYDALLAGVVAVVAVALVVAVVWRRRASPPRDPHDAADHPPEDAEVSDTTGLDEPAEDPMPATFDPDPLPSERYRPPPG